jgi:hypothetical protein
MKCVSQSNLERSKICGIYVGQTRLLVLIFVVKCEDFKELM